jgi:hypothetical protein
MTEQNYQELFDHLLTEAISPSVFVVQFMTYWRSDRDLGTQHRPGFQHMLDEVFVRCDQYEAKPEGALEISAQQLKEEINQLRLEWVEE